MTGQVNQRLLSLNITESTSRNTAESTSRNTACTISKKEKEIVSDEHTDSDTVSSVSATNVFGNDFPQIKRFVGNPKPMSFTKKLVFKTYSS